MRSFAPFRKKFAYKDIGGSEVVSPSGAEDHGVGTLPATDDCHGYLQESTFDIESTTPFMDIDEMASGEGKVNGSRTAVYLARRRSATPSKIFVDDIETNVATAPEPSVKTPAYKESLYTPVDSTSRIEDQRSMPTNDSRASHGLSHEQKHRIFFAYSEDDNEEDENNNHLSQKLQQTSRSGRSISVRAAKGGPRQSLNANVLPPPRLEPKPNKIRMEAMIKKKKVNSKIFDHNESSIDIPPTSEKQDHVVEKHKSSDDILLSSTSDGPPPQRSPKISLSQEEYIFSKEQKYLLKLMDSAECEVEPKVDRTSPTRCFKAEDEENAEETPCARHARLLSDLLQDEDDAEEIVFSDSRRSDASSSDGNKKAFLYRMKPSPKNNEREQSTPILEHLENGNGNSPPKSISVISSTDQQPKLVDQPTTTTPVQQQSHPFQKPQLNKVPQPPEQPVPQEQEPAARVEPGARVEPVPQESLANSEKTSQGQEPEDSIQNQESPHQEQTMLKAEEESKEEPSTSLTQLLESTTEPTLSVEKSRDVADNQKEIDGNRISILDEDPSSPVSSRSLDRILDQSMSSEDDEIPAPPPLAVPAIHMPANQGERLLGPLDPLSDEDEFIPTDYRYKAGTHPRNFVFAHQKHLNIEASGSSTSLEQIFSAAEGDMVEKALSTNTEQDKEPSSEIDDNPANHMVEKALSLKTGQGQEQSSEIDDNPASSAQDEERGLSGVPDVENILLPQVNEETNRGRTRDGERLRSLSLNLEQIIEYYAGGNPQSPSPLSSQSMDVSTPVNRASELEVVSSAFKSLLDTKSLISPMRFKQLAGIPSVFFAEYDGLLPLSGISPMTNQEQQFQSTGKSDSINAGTNKGARSPIDMTSHIAPTSHTAPREGSDSLILGFTQRAHTAPDTLITQPPHTMGRHITAESPSCGRRTPTESPIVHLTEMSQRGATDRRGPLSPGSTARNSYVSLITSIREGNESPTMGFTRRSRTMPTITIPQPPPASTMERPRTAEPYVPDRRKTSESPIIRPTEANQGFHKAWSLKDTDQGSINDVKRRSQDEATRTEFEPAFTQMPSSPNYITEDSSAPSTMYEEMTLASSPGSGMQFVMDVFGADDDTRGEKDDHAQRNDDAAAMWSSLSHIMTKGLNAFGGLREELNVIFCQAHEDNDLAEQQSQQNSGPLSEDADTDCVSPLSRQSFFSGDSQSYRRQDRGPNIQHSESSSELMPIIETQLEEYQDSDDQKKSVQDEEEERIPSPKTLSTDSSEPQEDGQNSEPEEKAPMKKPWFRRLSPLVRKIERPAKDEVPPAERKFLKVVRAKLINTQEPRPMKAVPLQQDEPQKNTRAPVFNENHREEVKSKPGIFKLSRLRRKHKRKDGRNPNGMIQGTFQDTHNQEIINGPRSWHGGMPNVTDQHLSTSLTGQTRDDQRISTPLIMNLHHVVSEYDDEPSRVNAGGTYLKSAEDTGRSEEVSTYNFSESSRTMRITHISPHTFHQHPYSHYTHFSPMAIVVSPLANNLSTMGDSRWSSGGMSTTESVTSPSWMPPPPQFMMMTGNRHNDGSSTPQEPRKLEIFVARESHPKMTRATTVSTTQPLMLESSDLKARRTELAATFSETDASSFRPYRRARSMAGETFNIFATPEENSVLSAEELNGHCRVFAVKEVARELREDLTGLCCTSGNTTRRKNKRF
ncbi:hypothetical protein ACA910_022105 [Epithemia clementina (nom. ined.)]